MHARTVRESLTLSLINDPLHDLDPPQPHPAHPPAPAATTSGSPPVAPPPPSHGSKCSTFRVCSEASVNEPLAARLGYLKGLAESFG